MSRARQAIQEFENTELEKMRTLDAFLRIPSVSSDPEMKAHMLKAAEFLESYFEKLGMDEVKIFPTDLHPVVFAEKRSNLPDAKTLLIYGHYDVQPPDPLDSWITPAFEPSIRGEYLFARGASDMKGQILASVFALESVLKTGELPINIKFILEGEEEIGSPSLEGFIRNHTDLLKCDMILNPDAGMINKDSPTIVNGLRGLVYFEIRIDGPKMDLHSGLFGGNVANPANVLAKIIAQLHNPDGSVAIPGFYDTVRVLSDEDRQKIAMNPTNEADFLKITGAPAIFGEQGYTLLERQGARPTLDVNGLYAGFIGEGAKTIIPAYAKAKISCRLVPDQDHAKIYELAEKHIRSLVPPTVTVSFIKHSGGPSYLADDAPGLPNLIQAFKETWQNDVVFKREGGSIPVATVMQGILGVKSILTGFGLPDDAIHSPNEHLHLPTWRKGIQAYIHFLTGFGS
jgi:acetylornithine deacetylase/succinyl-diaminopimelate desuccinylase-like protein